MSSKSNIFLMENVNLIKKIKLAFCLWRMKAFLKDCFLNQDTVKCAVIFLSAHPKNIKF
jgi:hypothetical protein